MNSDSTKTKSSEFVGLFRREAFEYHLRGRLGGLLLPPPPQIAWFIVVCITVSIPLMCIIFFASVPDKLSAHGQFLEKLSQVPIYAPVRSRVLAVYVTRGAGVSRNTLLLKLGKVGNKYVLRTRDSHIEVVDSPIAGVVQATLVAPGDNVSERQPLILVHSSMQVWLLRIHTVGHVDPIFSKGGLITVTIGQVSVLCRLIYVDSYKRSSLSPKLITIMVGPIYPITLSPKPGASVRLVWIPRFVHLWQFVL